MRVELYAPFLPQFRPSLHDAFAAVASGAGDNGETLAFDHHTSYVQKFAHRVNAQRVSLAEGVEVHLSLGAQGYGAAHLLVDVRDRDELHVVEGRLLPALNSAIESYCESLVADWPERHRLRGHDPRLGLSHSRALWWHRILLLPDDDSPRALRLFGEPFQVTETTHGLVANGFTSISSSDGFVDDDELGEVRAGLVSATEEWLLIDGLSRRLADGLVNATRPGELEQSAGRVKDLTGETILASLLVDEQRRHMANTALRVHTAAATCWNLVESRRALLERTESAHRLIQLDLSQAAAEHDESRNRLLFGFTVVTVIQSLMLILDFGSGGSLRWLSDTRVGVAGAMLLATCLVLARYIRSPSRARSPEHALMATRLTQVRR